MNSFVHAPSRCISSVYVRTWGFGLSYVARKTVPPAPGFETKTSFESTKSPSNERGPTDVSVNHHAVYFPSLGS